MIRSAAFDRFAERYNEGIRQGLTAAAYAYRNAVVEKLMQGYTTGAFSHGGSGVAGTVTVAPIVWGGSSAPATISVGTNVMYALFWEMGHLNVFTRRYERVEHWRDALEEQGEEMSRVFGRVFASVTGGLSAPDIQIFAGASPYHGPDPAPGFGGYAR